MNKIIEDYTLKILQSIESGMSFVNEQLPLYVNELLTYKTISYVLFMIVSLLFFVCSVVATIFVYKQHCKKNEKDERYSLYSGEILLFWTLTIPTMVISVFFFFNYINNLIQIIFAPRVWLIEYLRDFVK